MLYLIYLNFFYINSNTKLNILFFITGRELIRQKNRSDKFLLLSTADPPEVLSDWTHSLDHLFYQLKFLLCGGAAGAYFTNLENSIIKALQLSNNYRYLGEDKHIYGKLPTKISNTIILLFTDAGKICNVNSLKNSEKLLSLSTSGEDLNTHLYRWDNSLYSFAFTGPLNKSQLRILKSKDLSASYSNNTSIEAFNQGNKISSTLSILKRYSNIIGGECIMIESFDDLYIKCDELLMKKLFFNFVNLRFEINPNLASKILAAQSASESISAATDPTNGIISINPNIPSQHAQMQPQRGSNSLIQTSSATLPLKEEITEIKNFSLSKTLNEMKKPESEKSNFLNTNNFKYVTTHLPAKEVSKRISAKINIDFKVFKQLGMNPNDDYIADRNERVVYREKWPLPDDFLINKNMKILPKKNSNLSYLISSEMLFEIPCKIQDTDEYEIFDIDLLIKIIEFYPNVTLEDLMSQYNLLEVNKEISIKNTMTSSALYNIASPNPAGSMPAAAAAASSKTMNYLKIYFDVFLNSLETQSNFNFANFPNKPFAVIKFVLPIRLLKDAIKSDSSAASEKFIDFLKRIFNYEKNDKEDYKKPQSENKEILKEKEKDEQDLINEAIRESKLKSQQDDVDCITSQALSGQNNNKSNTIDSEKEKILAKELSMKLNLDSKKINEKNNLNQLNLNGVKFKLCVMPFNYKEFFSIVSSFEKVINYQ